MKKTKFLILIIMFYLIKAQIFAYSIELNSGDTLYQNNILVSQTVDYVCIENLELRDLNERDKIGVVDSFGNQINDGWIAPISIDFIPNHKNKKKIEKKYKKELDYINLFFYSVSPTRCKKTYIFTDGTQDIKNSHGVNFIEK